MSEQNKTDAVQSVAELQQAIAQRDTRIEEQAREIERLEAECARLKRSAQTNWNEFADGMKAQQPSSVVLPEQDGSNAQISFWAGFEAAVCGLHGVNIRAAWNEFKSSEQFARLNACQVSAGEAGAAVKESLTVGGVDEQEAFEDAMREDAEISGCDVDLSTLNRTVDGRLIYANPITQACWWARNQRAAITTGSAVPDRSEQVRHMVPKPLHELRIAYQLSSAGQYDSGAPEHRQTIAIQELIELLDFDEQEPAWETIRAYADMRAVDALFRTIEILGGLAPGSDGGE